MVKGAKKIARNKMIDAMAVDGGELFKYGVFIEGPDENKGPIVDPKWRVEKYKGLNLNQLLEIAKRQAKK